MKGKIFTVDEATRMLPLVARIADDIVATYAEVNRSLQTYEDAKAKAGTADGRRATPTCGRPATRGRRGDGPRPVPAPDPRDRGARRHRQGLRARLHRLLRRRGRRDRLPLLDPRREGHHPLAPARRGLRQAPGPPRRQRRSLTRPTRRPPDAPGSPEAAPARPGAPSPEGGAEPGASAPRPAPRRRRARPAAAYWPANSPPILPGSVSVPPPVAAQPREVLVDPLAHPGEPRLEGEGP